MLQLDEQVFMETRNIMAQFERASCTLVNTSVIPLFSESVPDWLINTGYQIAGREDGLRYLGVLTGMEVLNKEIAANIQLKYERRLKHWANRMARKEDDGLGLPPLQNTVDVFLIRNITKMLTEEEEDWLKIAKQLMQKALHVSPHTREQVFETSQPPQSPGDDDRCGRTIRRTSQQGNPPLDMDGRCLIRDSPQELFMLYQWEQVTTTDDTWVQFDTLDELVQLILG
ncbi:hypothetical protein R1sor_026309 [Riccia sorocarpa]|uniref:Uncharacterized protein n=1 Tax=Riccia sorocarpa TaxID=122646 RepID=A0ABD3GEP7_9MARC